MLNEVRLTANFDIRPKDCLCMPGVCSNCGYIEILNLQSAGIPEIRSQVKKRNL